ncbi:MAG: hypothetical protein ACK559_19755, partial [bacterium]
MGGVPPLDRHLGAGAGAVLEEPLLAEEVDDRTADGDGVLHVDLALQEDRLHLVGDAEHDDQGAELVGVALGVLRLGAVRGVAGVVEE